MSESNANGGSAVQAALGAVDPNLSIILSQLLANSSNVEKRVTMIEESQCKMRADLQGSD